MRFEVFSHQNDSLFYTVSKDFRPKYEMKGNMIIRKKRRQEDQGSTEQKSEVPCQLALKALVPVQVTTVLTVLSVLVDT